MKRLISNRFISILLLFIIIFLVIHFFWFRGAQFIYYWDQSFSFNPSEALKSYQYLWRNHVGFGNPDVTGINYLQVLYFYTFFQKTIGISLGQQILISFEIIVALLGFYFLASNLLRSYRIEPKLAGKLSWLGALFYVLNPFAIIYSWRLHLNSVFLYSALPIIFLFLMRLFNKDGSNVKNIIVLNLLLLFVIPSFSHPAYLISFWLLVVSYLCFLIIKSFREKKKNDVWAYLFKFVLLWTTWFLVNFWWIVPQIFGIRGTIALSGNDGMAAIDIVRTTTSQTSILNVIRLLGEWHYYDFHFGAPDYRLMNLFTSALSPYAVILFFPALIIIASYWKNKNLFKVFFGIVLILLILFIAGQRSAAWPLINLLYEKTSVIRAFRNPYEKIGIVYAFIYSVVLIISIADFHKSKRFNKIILLGFISLLFPMTLFLSGEIIPGGTNRIPAARTTVAESYKSAANYLKQNCSEQERILVLPFQHSPLQYSSKGENSYVAQDMLTNLAYLPTISTTTGNLNNDLIFNQIDKELNNGNLNSLQRYGIKFVVLDNSLRDSLTYGKNNSTEKLKKIFDESNNFSPVWSKDDLIIYKNSDYRPLFYTSDSAYVYGSKLSNVASTIAGMENTEDIISCFPKPQKEDEIDNYYCQNSFPIKEELSGEEGDMLIKNDSVYLSKKINLPKGKYKIQINNFIAGEIKLNNTSVTNGGVVDISGNKDELLISGDKENIQNVFDLNKDYEKVREVFLDDIVDKNNSKVQTDKAFPSSRLFTQTASKGKFASMVEIKNSGQPFKVSFYYKTSNESGPISIGVNEAAEKYDYNHMMQKTIKEFSAKYSNQWERYDLLYIPESNSDKVFFYLINDGTSVESKIQITDIKIDQVANPEINFTSVDGLLSENNNRSEILDLKVVDPTSYQFRLDNVTSPLFINFQNNFDQNWKLFINNREISEEKHFILNGASNSWLIDQTGNLEIAVKYVPQENLILCKKISSCSVILISIFGVVIVVVSKRSPKRS